MAVASISFGSWRNEGVKADSSVLCAMQGFGDACDYRSVICLPLKKIPPQSKILVNQEKSFAYRFHHIY
jgi:hypothetical protein